MHTIEEQIDEVGHSLKTWHGCHTAILYGSYAKGDFNRDSDIDIAGFGSSPESYRIAGPWRDTYVDAFVYPESKLA
ncbi:MAG TPA: nucleotidyltransferase domain-containing protein, partial [Usitatibacter sp.]|nr:nucleotidyltransferase domain-containing protein [Usitatibacter sp.]